MTWVTRKHPDVILIEKDYSWALDNSTLSTYQSTICIFVPERWLFAIFTQLFITYCILIFYLVWIQLFISLSNWFLSLLSLPCYISVWILHSYILSLCRLNLVIYLICWNLVGYSLRSLRDTRRYLTDWFWTCLLNII